MTFEEYIKNPMGIKSSVITNRGMYEQMYTEKWDALKVRENGFIRHVLYQIKEDYYIHLYIPSETIKNFYYDVIIRFYLPKDKTSNAGESTLAHYETQFYSNDPSFVYTFAHAFKVHGLFIKDLESKMSQQALKDRPEIKNPHDDIGYVKAFYFAYLEMKEQKLFLKANWKFKTKPYSKSVWLNTVQHADDKVADRQAKGAALIKKQRAEKRKEERKREFHSNDHIGKMNTEFVKKTDMNFVQKTIETKPKGFLNIDKAFGRFKKKK